MLHARNQFVHQQRNVFDTLAQRGHLDREYIQTVIQVFTERTDLDHVLEILVRRCNDSHIDALGFVAADPLEGALLQHTQQLNLHRQRHVADFVEEQGAAIGQLKAPGTTGDRPGKRALLMTEQFAFQQLGRYGSTVDRYERRITTLGVIVQIARNHFLASTGLTEDQHTGIGVGNLLHHLPNMLNRATGTHQTAKQVRLTMTTTLTGMIVHFTINLSTVQGIEQFAVAGRHFQRREHTTAQVLWQVSGRKFSH